MRADTIGVPVEDRPDLDRRFHRPPRFFHTNELFVGQSQVLGRKAIIVAVDDPHAVAFFLLLDGRLVQPEFAVCQPANIRAEAAARDKTTGALGMGFETPELFFEFFQELLPMLPLPVRFLRIMTDDIATILNPDFLDPQVLFDVLEPAGMAEHFFNHFRALPPRHGHDVMTAAVGRRVGGMDWAGGK